MKKFNRFFAIVLALAVVVSVAACGNSSETTTTTAAVKETTTADGAKQDATTVIETEPASVDYSTLVPEGSLNGAGVAGGTGYIADNVQRDVVNVAIPDLATNIQPWAGTAAGRHYTMYSFYQPLCEFDKSTGSLVMVLAEEINKIDDVTFEIKVRKGIVDTNGNAFTADDAVFSIESCKAAGNVSGMNKITSAEKVDDYTLKVTMNTKADYQFGSSITMIMMVTKASYEASGDEMATSPVGTGPYKITNYESGSTMTLEKVDNYWGADLADRNSNPDTWYYFAQNVDKIVYTKIAEASQESIALENGDIDVALGLSGTEAKRLQENSDYNVFSTVDSKSFNLFFNCGEQSVMKSQELRQAICYAVDTTGVLKSTGGYGYLSTTFGSAVFADCNPDWANEDYYSYNADKAAELVKASGVDLSTEIRIMVKSAKENLTIAQTVQGYIMAIGFTNVQIKEYDNASFASSKYDETLYDIRIDDASYTCLADLWTQFLSAGKNDKSYAQIKDDELETLLGKLGTAEGRSEENVAAAHYYIKDKAYCYGIYSKKLFNATANDIVEIAYMPKLYALPGAFCYQ